MKLAIFPHDDDGALFMSFLSIRERLFHVVVLDSYIQPNRGEVDCSASERAAETAAACDVLGCSVYRLELRDDDVTQEQIEQKFLELCKVLAITDVYGPAFHDGGNVHHNMVALAADRVWGKAVKRYTSYSRDSMHIVGDIEIAPTSEELDLKAKALACYVSQLRINRPHFDAVMGKSEWLMQ